MVAAQAPRRQGRADREGPDSSVPSTSAAGQGGTDREGPDSFVPSTSVAGHLRSHVISASSSAAGMEHVLDTPPVQFAPLSSVAPSYAPYHEDIPMTEDSHAQQAAIPDQGPSVAAEDYPQPYIRPTARIHYQRRPQRIRKRQGPDSAVPSTSTAGHSLSPGISALSSAVEMEYVLDTPPVQFA